MLEFLPWTEARTFHNVVMVKIEQGREDWSSDFAELAEQFLNRKVRLSLRSQGKPAGSGASRASGRGFGRQRYTRNEFPPNRYRTEICRQWNSGWCSYGQSCRMQHCCLTCANEGKHGEKHRASSHGDSTTKGKPSDQRV